MTWGRMQNPVRGLLHGSAAVAAAIGLTVLVMRTWGEASLMVGVVVFGVGLVAMYTVSALYHSVPWPRGWKTRLQRVDHSLIFIVVAGTFTPFAIAALDGWALATGLTLVWGIAVVGIVLKLVLVRTRTRLSVILQMTMGWSALIWLPWIVDRLGWAAMALILAGGVCYVIGTIAFVTKRPRLFPRVFSYHEVFHVLVVAGSGLHFWAIAAYVT